jgi:uncharacterized membrane protein required for colicin V production
MSATVRHTPGKKKFNIVPPLIISTIGILGLIALYFLVPIFQPLEIIALAIVVLFAALGITQNIVRGLMSALMIYIATGVAALLHLPLAPYIGAPFGDRVTPLMVVISFWALMLATWIGLEVAARALMRDTSLPRLSVLDNLGGMLIYLAIGLLVGTLVYNTVGFLPRWNPMHDAAYLRPYFGGVLLLHYQTQAFWFGGRPPALYVYDLRP